MMALLDMSEATVNNLNLNFKQSKRKVLGVDIDIRPHNRAAIEDHPMASYIEMIEGSSISNDIINKVKDYSKDFKTILVCLDSNHTHSHVLQELEAYAPLTSKNSYCVVFDTIIEDLPKGTISDRPWDKGDNAKTAVWDYLRILNTEVRNSYDGEKLTFEIDKFYENKTLITMAPDGFLKRV
jgi:cephalosporin hydroxylase